MLKPYNEMRAIDVKPFCESRKAKDENGKTIDVLYLNWAKCVDLLHENGAEVVYFTPAHADDGSFLFCSRDVSNKEGKKTGCYFVAVDIVIDELKFRMEYPLLNGPYVIYDDTLNQRAISTAHARAFVKGVAIRTGLGFDLWVKGGEEDLVPSDDLSVHSIMAIKRRVEELLTVKAQHMDMRDILSSLNINDKQLKALMNSFDQLNKFEQALRRV